MIGWARDVVRKLLIIKGDDFSIAVNSSIERACLINQCNNKGKYKIQGSIRYAQDDESCGAMTSCG